MATQVLNLKAAGLQTYYQTLMETSPGALLKANNTVINRAGVIEPRRGIATYGSSFGTINDRVKQLLEYKGTIIRHIGDELSYDDGTGSFTPFPGNYIEARINNRIRSTEAKSNLYFATTDGIKKISAKTTADFSLSDIIQNAGGPKGISPVLDIDATAGFLPTNKKVSYRIVWLYTDRNQNLILGAPSGSTTIENTLVGPDKSVELTFQIPYDVTTVDYKYRVYRSEVATSPSDEMNQVYESSPTTIDLTNGYITVIDSVSEDNRIAGIPLYTNQNSGEGILQANEPPPAAKDLALFKGHMFYANTRTRHSTIFTILDVGGLTAGVSDFIIGDVGSPGNTYTFDVTEDILTKKIKIFPGDIEKTAKSMVTVINGDPNEVVSAYYLSVFGEAPGKILLQRKDLFNTFYYLGTTDATITNDFSPQLGEGATLQTEFRSSTEEYGNRLYYSKYQEVEAVPLLNYIDVGSRDQEIYRIVVLRESLFIFKGDGVFRLSGDPGATPSWNVTVFDNTSIIKAPDTAVTLANQCYYYSNQGVTRLNEASIEVVSQPIQDKLLPFIATNKNLDEIAFAVSYESDRALLLWTVLSKDDITATVCYRYNIITEAWTEWKVHKTCAVLNRPEDKLYFGSGSDNYVEIERKTFTRFDYADREIASSLSFGYLIDNIIKISNFNAVSLEDVLLQEQYVTIYQFNALLKKLDLDNGLVVHNFYDELKMNNGDGINAKISALVAKLNIADPSTDYVTLWTNPAAFKDIQTDFNTIVAALNASVNTIFTNYQLSSGTIKFEAIIISLDNIKKEITLNINPAFMLGPLSIYKGIKTEIEYAPQHAGDPASHKQFSTGTFMFERRSFYTAQTAYKSDISDNYEEISFVPNSAGTFGNSTWGDGTIWGGQGDQSQIRTYIPLKKQRCRFLGCKFTHGVALESFQLYGLSLSVRQYAIPDRDYK